MQPVLLEYRVDFGQMKTALYRIAGNRTRTNAHERRVSVSDPPVVGVLVSVVCLRSVVRQIEVQYLESTVDKSAYKSH